MDPVLGDRLARNLAQLRTARGLTQSRAARLAGIPRSSWTHLESGAGNPTLEILHRVARALQVPLEELVSSPRAEVRLYKKGTLPVRTRGQVIVHRLLPDPIPATEMDRLELPPGSRMTGVPHTPGTREYLACEHGTIRLVAAGEQFLLEAGDVVAFRGDQPHSYANPGQRAAVGYSVVVLAHTP
jgi:transcriptional regulator with XRE-family HTH domain